MNLDYDTLKVLRMGLYWICLAFGIFFFFTHSMLTAVLAIASYGAAYLVDKQYQNLRAERDSD